MIVRSIDTGYGNTKFIRQVSNHGQECFHFPSIVAPCSSNDFGSGALQKKEVIRVSVGTNEFIVGPDAHLSIKNGNGRILGQNYIEKDAYLALVRGALKYIDTENIDLLVTGLPVSFFRQHKDKLEQRLTGVHFYPDGSKVNVQETWVIPQPVGGFLHYTKESGSYASLRETNCLIIDVGFFSVDWLVCRGLKVIDERSGSTEEGMSRLLEALAQVVGDDLNEALSDINRLDTALLRGNQLGWYGKTIDISRYLPRVEHIVNSACEAIFNSVGPLNDIGRVILVGGGAQHYLAGIQRACRQHAVNVVNNPLYANVMGYQFAGIQKGGNVCQKN